MVTLRNKSPPFSPTNQTFELVQYHYRAAAYTNNSQSVLLNMLSSEFAIIDNPFEETEPITGLFLLNKNLFLHTKLRYAFYDMRGALIEKHQLPDITDEWELLCKYSS